MKTAQCSCGNLKAEVPDGPLTVFACHCAECQRRTGSVMGVGAYYSRSKVSISGEGKTFWRSTDSGKGLTNFFCPVCGTTLYWIAEIAPDLIGVAVGGFADPAFPPPAGSTWEQSHHSWVGLPQGTMRFAKGMSAEARARAASGEG